MIFFKIYACNKNGQGLKYLSGRKMIKPASEVTTCLSFYAINLDAFTNTDVDR